MVQNRTAFQMTPELKGYGRVLDPAPLAALMTELATARAAYTASSNELARLKVLEAQGNASVRAIQTAEAAALRDRLAVRSVRERLTLSWGKAVGDRQDLPAFARSLVSLEAALVRVDLPVGKTLKGPPAGARIATLSGQSAEAEFLGIGDQRGPADARPGLHLPAQAEFTTADPRGVGGRLSQDSGRAAGRRDHPARGGGAGGRGGLGLCPERRGRRLHAHRGRAGSSDRGWLVRDQRRVGHRFVVVTGAQQLLSFELRGKGEK